VPPAFAVQTPLELLVPADVAVVASRTDVEAPLFPVEEAALCQAVATRRREFTTGRACAREALARLGLAPESIPVGEAGAPRWPEGVVGSITHCRGCRAAAVGRTADFAAIGIDAEPNRRLPAGTLRAIALPVELERVRQLQWQAPGICWDRLLFSAKESVYKVWFPLAGARLGFEDAEVAFEPSARRFSVRLRKPFPARGGGPSSLWGRWSAEGGLVVTAIVLPTPDRADARGD
jgi:4'-phosphopantetheinyl transferase EntD